MNLKGAYDSTVSYSVGDVVKYTDGRWYFVDVAPGAAGVACTNTKYWNLKDPVTADILDLLGDAILGLNPNPKNIVLASSSDDSTKKFKIKVVDNGTISATEIS